jgi:hypothetical protein
MFRPAGSIQLGVCITTAPDTTTLIQADSCAKIQWDFLVERISTQTSQQLEATVVQAQKGNGRPRPFSRAFA